MAENTAILVCSCDKYDDVWPAFFTLLFRYWPNCNLPIYLLANNKSYRSTKVQTIHTPVNADWSTCFKYALEVIPEMNVLVVMEDYLLDRNVDDARIRLLTEEMNRQNAICMHLYPDPFPAHSLDNTFGIGIIARQQPFRVNLQAAIWDRLALIDLVRPGENAWDFEVEGTKRSTELGRMFLSVDCDEDNSPFYYYRTGVVRGKWMPGALKLCEREGICLDLKRRKVGWVRGYIREQSLFKPFRKLYVSAKRFVGLN
jgi:hypothetical protein